MLTLRDAERKRCLRGTVLTFSVSPKPTFLSHHILLLLTPAMILAGNYFPLNHKLLRAGRRLLLLHLAVCTERGYLVTLVVQACLYAVGTHRSYRERQGRREEEAERATTTM